MSNALTFNFENTSLTVLGDGLSPLFIAKQVCDLLGFGNPYQALKDHCDSEDVTKIEMLDRLNRKQQVNCVNESGLYALIFGSKLPKAKQFKRWVTNEVLPAIRKQGFYSVQEQDNALISNEQQYELSSRVMRKTYALFGNKNYSFVYRALKRRFRIPRYTCLLQKDFETALAFVDGLKVSDFHVPDVQEDVPAAVPRDFVVQYPTFTISSSGSGLPAIPRIPENRHYITDNELQALKSLDYFFNDLFKPLIVWAAKEAFKQGHPEATRFYDVWHEPIWLLGRIKQIISRNS